MKLVNALEIPLLVYKSLALSRQLFDVVDHLVLQGIPMSDSVF